MSIALVTFDSTHMALWAEEVARAHRIPVELVPVPPGTGALCDLALTVAATHSEALSEALEETGVVFRAPIAWQE